MASRFDIDEAGFLGIALSNYDALARAQWAYALIDGGTAACMLKGVRPAKAVN